MKKSVLSFLCGTVAAASLAFVCNSCASYKDIAYFQNIDQNELGKLTTEYEAIIAKDDRLVIIVSGPDKTVIGPYNFTIGEMTGGSYSPENSILSYLVDSDGNIEFPILGKIHVEGMTRNQLVEYLTKEIGKDVKNPVVYVAFRNYIVTVLGEVRRPGNFRFDNEKVNILQALGEAGDLQLTAQRNNIILLREVDGVQTHRTIDLRDSHLLESPDFYLQKNDVIIVPPSESRVAMATNTSSLWSSWLSLFTAAFSATALILSLK